MEEPRVIQGRYRLGDKLGEGGYGAVYRAEHLAMGTQLALKLLHPIHSHDPKVTARFEQEAKRSARLKHPHTIHVFDFGQAEDGALFLAMELLDGRTLTDALSTGPLAPERAVHILELILSALSAAHGLGLVHRDLKPDNIFLVRVGDDADFVKVLDFGIAKALDASTEITASGTIIGTPAYMAPEQCRGAAVDARSDLYALGALAYHMLVGQAPFRSDNALGYLLAHVQEAPAPLPASVPPGLASWVLRLLAKAPDDRFASAEEARVQLASALTGEATWQFAARADHAPAPLTHHAGAAAAMPTRKTRKTLTAGGPKRWLWIAGGVGLTAAIVLLAVRPGGTTPQGAEPPSGPVANAIETLDELKSAKAMTARLGVQTVRDAALLFEATYYKAPESIHALVERGQLRHGARLDPWGREYRFDTRAGKTRVCSLGRDGVPDTAGASGGDDICAE